MGIHGLTKVIQKYAPSSAKQVTLNQLSGYKIAVDGNLSLYQFLTAVRLGGGGGPLTNRNGEVTSHLNGLFYKTIGLLSKGIKPIFVFDGKPPDIKVAELQRRKSVRDVAQEKMKTGAEEGADAEAIDRWAVRATYLSHEQVYDAKKLLFYMGIPIIQAPSEAEAQCAVMAKSGLVYATGSEDMDSLAFGSPVILRHLSMTRSSTPLQITLEDVLSELELTFEQFLDFCILLGCDYCEAIKGIGPKRALDMIRKYGTIEKMLEGMDKSKYIVPENWPDIKQVRASFKNPIAANPKKFGEFVWDVPMEEEIRKLLVDQNQFAAERVAKQINILKKARKDFPEPNQSNVRKILELPAPPPELDRKGEIEDQIQDFLDAHGKRELIFPPTLSASERRIVHIVAAKNRLTHQSFGEPGQRRIKVTKTDKTKGVEPELREDTYLS